MENKEIIIDGVDVNGCEHRCDTHKTLLADGHIMEFKNYCQITNDGCYAINCYYKQLKRKEQECEELEENLPNAITRLMGELDQLKAENERLINKGRIECLYCEYKNTKADLTRLKQTITEIKDYCNKYPQNSIGFKQQILQKISEVEECSE